MKTLSSDTRRRKKPGRAAPTGAPRPATLADVARVAKCSAPVVSAVLNQSRSSARFSEDLATRIREAADQLGYCADFASQSLARRSTRTIGVYVPPSPANSFAYPYESGIVAGIERVCQERGYDLLAINLAGGTDPAICDTRFAERRISGLVVLHVPDVEDWLERLVTERPLTVSVNCHVGDTPLFSVNFDDHAAATMAADHLASLGHRRIAYAGNFRATPDMGSRCRRDAFVQAMHRHGLEVPAEWVIDRNTSGIDWAAQPMGDADGARFAVDWLTRLPGPWPTAVVCYNDVVAVSLAKAIRRAGLRVPEEISVTGIDDAELGRYFDPAITTIRQPLGEMGARAAARLLDAIEADASPGASLSDEPEPLVQPTLVIRESTAPPPAEGDS